MIKPPHAGLAQEIAEFLNVEMSPRSRALQPQQPGPPSAEAEEAASEQRASSKHVVESRTDQDCMDDGYRCVNPGLPGLLRGFATSSAEHTRDGLECGWSHSFKEAASEQRASSKHVAESRTDQDCMDDGYRCARELATRAFSGFLFYTLSCSASPGCLQRLRRCHCAGPQLELSLVLPCTVAARAWLPG